MTDIPIRPSIRRRHEAIGGKLVRRLTIALALLIGVALFFLYQRFVYGLGAVTNINNGYPWGIWVVWDVIIATGFACGGYAMALLVYILNRGEFHPMIRAALTASVFGYSLGGLSVLIDLGRYWNFWHILSPSYFNPGSVMFEVAACITLYIVVLWIEWFPTFLEWLGTRGIQKAFERMLFVFIGLGVLLPSMHQSSLGSLLIAMGYPSVPSALADAVPAVAVLDDGPLHGVRRCHLRGDAVGGGLRPRRARGTAAACKTRQDRRVCAANVHGLALRRHPRPWRG